VYWAIADGAPITGITMHKAAPKVDSGPILAQSAVPILPTDTAGTLTKRLVEAGMPLLPVAVDGLLHDSTGIEVDMSDSSYRTSIGHRSLEEAGSAEEAERMVRAGAPNMLPWVMRDGRAVYVREARVANGESPDGLPVLHYPNGDLLLVETMDTCGCHHNTNDCAHRRTQTVTGR
jgi:methionyl-tRNA formyltransferase